MARQLGGGRSEQHLHQRVAGPAAKGCDSGERANRWPETLWAQVGGNGDDDANRPEPARANPLGAGNLLIRPLPSAAGPTGRRFRSGRCWRTQRPELDPAICVSFEEEDGDEPINCGS